MPDDHRDHTGEVRRLGWIAPSSEQRKPRASRTALTTLRSNAGLPPIIPRSEWVPREFVTGSPDLINDQRDCSGCTGWSAAGGAMRQRWISGQEILRLSGAAIYAQINNGRDEGSNIIDALHVLSNTGTCLESEIDYPNIFEKQIPAGKLRYKESLPVTLATADECATALLMGMLPQVPVMIWSGFENFDGDGVARTYQKHGYGNHSVYLGGLERVGGRWVFRLVNSWGPNWGPFRDGTCRIELDCVENCAYAEDSYAHAATMNP